MANVLGAKIKGLRKEKALTLEQLAEKIGSGKSYIWEIENKGVKRPSAEKLAAIAKALDVTTDYLIDDTQTEVSDDLEKEVFYRKLGQLDKGDQDRIMDMIDAWSKK
ncbi:helix-turn-helix domain-containing protein [Microbulbifer sp. OS29]|uniref:Helix-turn-helix domain-containing protein n=1 Tax=Microbulbifer okhotskensis TaxID=2926617 RepID=A0A9X2EIZ2_9GAMM|nr:helix-turn-helix domain-containing protein [Microbulbifer okhotskensis]MCO1333097.1 helix-turn-helix domain-containing protein [Microbulbifer okhotskensis]